MDILHRHVKIQEKSICSAAQILGLVGSARKRTLTLWQAVEFSRANEMAITSTLQASTNDSTVYSYMMALTAFWLTLLQ